jgi:hypothetical protein
MASRILGAVGAPPASPNIRKPPGRLDTFRGRMGST